MLTAARRLTPEEQRRLRDELVEPGDRHTQGPGARFVAYLESLPLDDSDRADLDAMKHAIEDGCERVDNGNW